MARIVFGMGISHGPMMGCPPEQWTTAFRKGDQNNTLLWYRKEHLSYDELVRVRASEQLERFLTDEETSQRHGACQAAVERLMSVYHEVNPDVLVIIGNDHREVFTTVTPALGIYTSPVHDNGLAAAPKLFEGAFSPAGFYGPAEPVQHAGTPELGRHVIEHLKPRFDITVIEDTPVQGSEGRRVTPHAFGFVYHHLLKDDPPPSLPVHINTFFPPNQPSMRRVFDFSEALVDAIESWETDQTVAIIGSGGLTHFIVDEELDGQLLDALGTDLEKLTALDERLLQSGTSEIKNWVPAAVAMRRQGVPMTLVDYVPCYRSPAGNGHAMTYAYWRP